MSKDNRLYSTEEKKEWVELSFISKKSSYEISAIFGQRNPERKPSPLTVQRLINKFKRTGSVANIKKPGRPRTTITDDKAADVLAKIMVSPIKSSRKLGPESGISKSSARNILKKYKFFPYKMQTIQRLGGTDFERRLEFSQWGTEQIDLNAEFTRKIIFSDEAMFYLNGQVNRQTTRYWCNANPYWAVDSNTQSDPRVMVWCGIWGDRIIGPFFFDNSVNGHTYLELLMEKLWPQISQDPNLPEAMFQQDGAPGHFALTVRNWLNSHFPGKWIGRGGPIGWAPRSPDLTPLDFFLWGYLKSRVYVDRPRTLDDLRANIVNACATVTPEMLKNVRAEWDLRLKHCIAKDGEQFEHCL
jgi:hypothetical protein